MSVFLDSGVLFGAFNKNDEYHEAALGICLTAFSGKWGAVYTSDYVLDETVTLLKVSVSSQLALRFLNRARESRALAMVNIDEALFDRTCGFFERYYDRPGMSFTDAATLAVLQAIEIDHLASFDGRSFDGIVKNRIEENFWVNLSDEDKRRILRSQFGGLVFD